MSKKISIILPVYNTEKYLNRCLESIFVQNFKDFELICINDASTDNSLEILREFADKHADYDIKILSHEINKGQAYCKNIAIKQAKGDYLAFLDSDDFISDNFLSEMINAAVNNNSEIVMCNCLEQDKDSLKFSMTGNRKRNKQKVVTTFVQKFSLLTDGSCCDKLFKTAIIKENNITFPERYLYEDNEFLAKAAFYANKIVKIGTCFYYYCHNEKSSTRDKFNNEKLKLSASKLLNNIFEFFQDKKLSEKEMKILIQFCIYSFCFKYVQDDDFQVPEGLDKEVLKKIIAEPKYKNIFQRIFSIKNTTGKTKVLTILFIPICLKRRQKDAK